MAAVLARSPPWHLRPGDSQVPEHMLHEKSDEVAHPHGLPPRQQDQRQGDGYDTDRGYDSFEGKCRPTPVIRSTTTSAGNYRPMVLRWPFLVAQMVLLLLAMTSVVVMQSTTPDSDDSAVVDGRPLVKLALIAGRDEAGTVPTATEAAKIVPNTDSGGWEDDGGFEDMPLYVPPDDPVSPGTETTTADVGGVTLSIPNADPSNAGAGFQPSNIPTAGPLSHDPSQDTITESPISISGGTRVTFSVARGSTDFVQPGPEPTEVDGPSFSAAGVPERPPHGLLPVFKTVESFVDPVTTTLVVAGESQTSFDAAGSPTLVPPVSQTVVAVWGGTRTTGTVVDDGLAAETSTMITMIAGSPVTLLAITTPGRPVTETAVSVVGGTAVTIVPEPVTSVVDMGDGTLVTAVSTPPAFVTTTGGTTTTLTRVTTPGRRTTSSITTRLDGTPTVLLTVLTITPTPTTNTAAYPAGAPTHRPTNSTSGAAAGDGNPGRRYLPGFTHAQYFAGAFLPTLVAAALAMPLAVVDSAAKQYAPFSALARPGGAAGRDSLTLDFAGAGGVLLVPVQQALRGLPVPLATGALAALGRALAPLAAEAVGYKLHGRCKHLEATGCGIAFGVSPGPASALVGVLAAMVVLVAVVGVLLARWETGLCADPGSVAAMAALSQNGEMRRRLVGTGEPNEAALQALFAEGRFGLGHFKTSADGGEEVVEDDGHGKSLARASSSLSDESDGEPTREYGILPLGDTILPLSDTVSEATTTIGPCRVKTNALAEGTPADFGPRHVPFLALTYTARAIFMVLLLALMALIIYYHLLKEDNAFELFMDSQSFGVKLLFSALGSVITTIWTSFFMSK